MIWFLLRRLLMLPPALLAVHFLGFSYAHLAQRAHAAQNPFGAVQTDWPPIGRLYSTYWAEWLGLTPLAAERADTLAGLVLPALGMSLGLLLIAFIVSTGLGLLLGVGATRAASPSAPPGVRRWLAPLLALGLSTPSFFIGTLAIVLLLLLNRGNPDAQTLIPLFGAGWDRHLILPVLALVARPVAQIASVSTGLLAGELGKRYVTTAYSLGISARRVRWKHALWPVLAPITLTVAGSARLLMGELLLVERLFAWPGLGRLLTLALVPPATATAGGLQGANRFFLHPELVAATLTAFALLFLLIDALATGLARKLDPRQRQEAHHA